MARPVAVGRMIVGRLLKWHTNCLELRESSLVQKDMIGSQVWSIFWRNLLRERWSQQTFSFRFWACYGIHVQSFGDFEFDLWMGHFEEFRLSSWSVRCLYAFEVAFFLHLVHPQIISLIWQKFGREEVGLFAFSLWFTLSIPVPAVLWRVQKDMV